MGRPGGGGSSGGHSGGMQSGGHHVGGGSTGGRPGGGGGMHGPGGMGGPGMRDPYGPRGPRRGGFFWGPRWGGFGWGGYGGGLFRPWISIGTYAVLAIVFFLLVFFSMVTDHSEDAASYTSTIEREKLTGVASYDSDCVIDEIGWISSTDTVGSELSGFYDTTGMQPYIYLKAYDETLTTDDEKLAWAEDYFADSIGLENGFLYVYFAEEDSDTDMGYMCYVTGTSASGIFDSEAENIFWSYVDQYWYSDLSMDDMLVTVFTKTADTIMQTGTTSSGSTGIYVVFAVIVALIAAIILGVVIYQIIKEQNRRAAEKAKETETILNTPLEHMNDEGDDLIHKYTTGEKTKINGKEVD